MSKKKKNFEVNEEYDEIFENLRQEKGLTVTGTFEYLIDNYRKFAKGSEPIEVIKDNPEDKVKITELENRIKLLVEQQESDFNNAESLSTDYSNLQTEYSNLQTKYNDVVSGLEGHDIVALEPINKKLLEFVAAREGKKRNQGWKISDVVNYFVFHRFEKGDIYGGFESVPDSEVRKMRKELEIC